MPEVHHQQRDEQGAATAPGEDHRVHQSHRSRRRQGQGMVIQGVERFQIGSGIF